jgi:hypothetical protein
MDAMADPLARRLAGRWSFVLPLLTTPLPVPVSCVLLLVPLLPTPLTATDTAPLCALTGGPGTDNRAEEDRLAVGPPATADPVRVTAVVDGLPPSGCGFLRADETGWRGRRCGLWVVDRLVAAGAGEGGTEAVLLAPVVAGVAGG